MQFINRAFAPYDNKIATIRSCYNLTANAKGENPSSSGSSISSTSLFKSIYSIYLALFSTIS